MSTSGSQTSGEPAAHQGPEEPPAGLGQNPAEGGGETPPLTLPTAEHTRAFGRALADQLRAGDVLLLVGELGAGKTTFTQGLGEGLGVRGPVASPTFVISRVHPSLTGGPRLVHVDAYRLGDDAELDDLDLDADTDTAVTVVEWGAGMAEQLADSYLVIELTRAVGDETLDAMDGRSDTGGISDDTVEDRDPRLVRVRAVGPRWAGEAGSALIAAGAYAVRALS